MKTNAPEVIEDLQLLNRSGDSVRLTLHITVDGQTTTDTNQLVYTALDAIVGIKTLVRVSKSVNVTELMIGVERVDNF